VPKSVLTQNEHLAPSTQQAKRSWLNMRDESWKHASQFSRNWQRNTNSEIKHGTCQVVPDRSIFTDKSQLKWYIATTSYLSAVQILFGSC
jgi:hypothetical protein